jgi:hypothetical protein
MEARVLTWTRLDRPPAGFTPGRVILLVEADDGAQHYAVWMGGEPPEPDTTVQVLEQQGAWVAE